MPSIGPHTYGRSYISSPRQEPTMDAETVRTIHRYGAILSILATVGAVVAALVGGPLSWLVFPLGFYGPLSGFYFVGGVLVDRPGYTVLGEELLRGVVWYGASLFAWAMILGSSSVLPVTAWTVLGLPALTALAISLAMVAIRSWTGLDLKVQSEGGQLLVVVTGAVVGGFLVLYGILAQGRSALLAVAYLLAVGVGVLIWRRHWAESRTGS